MKGRRFAAVIFDMDGVLVDSEPMHAETADEVLAEFGVTFGVEDSARYFGFTDAEMFADLVARHRLPVPVDELIGRRNALAIERTWQDPRPMDGVPDVLESLRRHRYRLALASSSAPEIIAATLDALAVRPLFDVVVSGVTVGRGKPAPDIFLETARQLGVAPAACLVVEDSRNGLLAAKAAGTACASVPCEATSGEDFSEADYRFKTLRDLLPLLT
ncbi:MAG: HAD family phosphatase [Candidatus Rokubacteria bacterium]|nr:HAD family phosphatase [Candidatus Rokubacteria bacterium]